MADLLQGPRAWRVRSGAGAILQTALSAALGWAVASWLGFDRPFFVAAAAVITLGATSGKRSRRALELVVGVAIGVLVADLLVLALGTGPLQIGLVTGLAMTAALLVGGGPVLVNQAAITAIVVMVLEPPGDGLTPERFLQALLGGGIALLVGQVLLPADPVRAVARAADPVFDRLAAALESTAAALAAGDRGRAESALLDARAVDPLVRELQDTLQAAQEVARAAPARRRLRGQLDLYAQASVQVDLAVRNTRVLARAALAATRQAGPAPPALVVAVGELATAVRLLGRHLLAPDGYVDARRPTLDAVAHATELTRGLDDLPTVLVVGQIRSTAVDLLRASGLDLATALSAVEEAASGA